MKEIIVISLTLILLTSWDCEKIYDYNHSKEVFIGTVIKLQLTEDKSFVIATLDVKEIYKKDEYYSLDTLNSVEIQSYFGTVAGYDWEIGKTYLVFVESIENQLRIVNMCSATSKIKFMYDTDGKFIGVPSLEEVKKWWHKEEHIWKEN